MNRLIPALVIIMLAYLAPPPPMGGCPHHGQRCKHGSSCPTVQRQLASEAAASCHTSHGREAEETKRYRCSISSCHGDASPGVAGLEAPFIVNLDELSLVRVSSATVHQDSRLNEDPFPNDIVEPPEGFLLS